jgi:hypothetical protein
VRTGYNENNDKCSKKGTGMSDRVRVFDSLQYAKKLQEVGFTNEQAEVQAAAIIDLIDDNLATKHDVTSIRNNLVEMEERLNHRVTDVEERLDNRITDVAERLGNRITDTEERLDNRLTGLEERLSNRINEMGYQLTIKLGGMLASGVILLGAFIALIKFI